MFYALKFIPIAGMMSIAWADGPDYPPRQAVQLVEIALERNPSLASARLNAEAAHSTGYHHRAWPAPEVAVDFFAAPVSDFPNPVSRNQMEIDYSLSQMIPFPGKLKGMSEPAHLLGEAEEKRAESSALVIRRQVLTAYAELYLAEWRLRLAREDRAEADRLLAAARAGYEGGMGGQADVLRAESEAVRLDAEILDMQRMSSEAQSMLSALLGKPGIKTVGGVDSIVPRPHAFILDTLKEQAFVRRPDLESMRREVAMAESEISASRKEALPDFMVRGMYKDMKMGQNDDWSVMVGMQIPFAPWSIRGVTEGTKRARLLRRKVERDYVYMRLMVESEVEIAVSALESASGRLELSKGRRIPLAAQALQSSLAAYQGGKMDFNDLLMAFRELRMARESYHMAVAEHLKAWAALEWAVGGELWVTATKGEQP